MKKPDKDGYVTVMTAAIGHYKDDPENPAIVRTRSWYPTWLTKLLLRYELWRQK